MRRFVHLEKALTVSIRTTEKLPREFRPHDRRLVRAQQRLNPLHFRHFLRRGSIAPGADRAAQKFIGYGKVLRSPSRTTLGVEGSPRGPAQLRKLPKP